MTALADLVAAVAGDLGTRRDELNRLDAVAGDGDLGITVSTGAAAVLELLPELADLGDGEAIRRIGRELASKAPSSLGTLVAFALMAAGKAEVAADDPGVARTATYLEIAAQTIAARGGAKAGDRTMLDALLPGAAAMRAATEQGQAPVEAVRAAAAAADDGAMATSGMTATIGRAGWLADRAAGREDAGARLVAMAFDAAARHLAAD